MSPNKLPIQLETILASADYSQMDIKSLSEEFEKSGSFCLPNFLSQTHLKALRSKFEKLEWHETKEKNLLYQSAFLDFHFEVLINFMLANNKVIDILKAITQLPITNKIALRSYRMTETGEHLGWHQDNVNEVLLGVVVNLSEEPYSGGEFQLRRKDGPIISTIHNNTPGGLHIFKISEEYEHQVMPVKGKSNRETLAGWYYK